MGWIDRWRTAVPVGDSQPELPDDLH